MITGGGRGIGAAVAGALGRAGAGVVVAARTVNQIDRVAADLRDHGARAWAVACDVTDEDSVKNLGHDARAHLGAVDILVNNAGNAASAPLKRMALADWNSMLAVNATSTFLCTREFAPGMTERGWGRVVNIASVAGIEGAKYIAHYSAAKHAVVGFTRSMALELKGSGVTINTVCPGYVDTPMTERTIANVEERTHLSRDKALAAVLASSGQARLITPHEVAAAVLRLCNDDANGTNGQAIVINAGSSTSTRFEIINPGALGAPRGFNHGILAPNNGRLLFVAGQPGWEHSSPGEPPRFADQFARALDKVLAVVRAAGGQPADVVRLTVYVTDLDAYRASLGPLGEAWRARFGNYYPAMALIEVAGLVDRGALVEVEATAVIGGHP